MVIWEKGWHKGLAGVAFYDGTGPREGPCGALAPAFKVTDPDKFPDSVAAHPVLEMQPFCSGGAGDMLIACIARYGEPGEHAGLVADLAKDTIVSQIEYLKEFIAGDPFALFQQMGFNELGEKGDWWGARCHAGPFRPSRR
jgi:hypothetical protein